MEVMGYVSIKEDGIALYYSKRDYKYETNECAILATGTRGYERRKIRTGDGSGRRKASRYLYRDRGLRIGRRICGCRDISKKDQDKEGYLLEGQRYKNKPPMMQVYRQEEEVSMYRVMARPWDYYGRTIWMECVKRYGWYFIPEQ